jgi:predicted  nucleic acid-binding Zn-ribbon protein
LKWKPQKIVYLLQKEELKTISSFVFGEHSHIIAERDELEKELLKLIKERSVGARQINQEDYQLYETLRKKNRGIAVAVIEESCCSACGLLLHLQNASCKIPIIKSILLLVWTITLRRLIYDTSYH